jgi:flagellar basal-body rod protein FlgC
MFDSLDISASGLRAQRVRMDTIAQNVANINTTHDENGRAVPYRRRFAVFTPGQPEDSSKPGVRVSGIELDRSPFRKVYDPTNPDADAEGNVLYPNIDLAVEVVNAMEASRAYEANVTAMEVTKAMINASLRLLV